jgi:alkylation response protein AidB-like acyl-CoA dehydrogenase
MPIDFELSEAQQLTRQSVREFAEREIAPHVMEWDEAQEFSPKLWGRLAELGLLGCLVPEDFGGTGLGYLDFALVIEELARVDPSVALSVAAHNSLPIGHILIAGSAEHRRKFLPLLASGRMIGAWGLTEPGAGSDAGGTRTSATRDGAYWVLNGSKNFITNASFADLYVVMAVTDRARGKKGISAFLVEAGTAGFAPGKKENKLGMRASNTATVDFTDCRIPADHLLGELNQGFIDSLRVLDGGRVGIAALAIGLGQGAYEAALSYAQERHQFGTPIADFQAIQFKLVDMHTQIEASRLLTFRAASLRDRGQPCTKESAIAKLFASEAAVGVAGEAVQILGGYGFIKDFPVEKYYRDCKLLTIGEGTSEIQRLVIGRHILQHP